MGEQAHSEGPSSPRWFNTTAKGCSFAPFMWLEFEKKQHSTLKNPSMIVAVSTSLPQYQAMYSQARELGKYMLAKMDFLPIGTIHSSSFPPEVLIREGGVTTLPACHFYLNKGKKDLVLFAGDTSPMDDQYEFAQILLGYAKDIGVKELFSIGARWAENPAPPESDPEPNGFATDKVGVAKLKKHGVKIVHEEPAPFFSSMVVGMAADYGIRGYKLSVDHGEPSPHSRSVAKMLGILSEMASFEVALDDLKAGVSSPSPPRQAGDSTIYH
jgi:proteasome assembly chaperone (PAC2) family protein